MDIVIYRLIGLFTFNAVYYTLVDAFASH